MYITPVGVNVPLEENRQPLWKATGGDALYLTTFVTLRDGTTPVTPENSKLTFSLTNTRFSKTPIWNASGWRAGIEEVNPDHPGLVIIKLPDDISDSLRRGSYTFSLLVANRFGKDEYTAMKGTLLIEYEATSPQHDIPYK